jgi:multidrug transporter EmrE-like cation transporter
MAWFFILFADVFEVAWLFVLRGLAPLSRWAPLFVVILFSVPTNFQLAEAVKRLPAATVYAAFTGIGTAGTAIIGILSRKHEYRPLVLFSSDRDGADWS